MPPVVADPLPLRFSQVRALVAVTARESVWGRRAVAREIAEWRHVAERIPCDEIRADALEVLTRKRGNTDGAALFWVLASPRDLRLLRLLIAHELIWDFLDSVHERSPDERNGRQLHGALVESLDPRRPISDHYLFHPWRDDGGFLTSLIATCRRCLACLPSYDAVRPLVVREAARGAVQSIIHQSNAARRAHDLERWARAEYSTFGEIASYELAAAASAPLTIYALLALAAGPAPEPQVVQGTYVAYFPWVSLATVMLDSYVDLYEDDETGAQSYLANYRDQTEAIQRLHEILARAAAGVLHLPGGERHAVLVACMAAMYLSKDSVRSPELRETTRSIAAAGGSLTRLLVPVLRIWRVAHGQQSA